MKKKVSSVLALAVILIIVWILATVTKFIAGALLNLVLLAAVVLLAVWAFGRLRR